MKKSLLPFLLFALCSSLLGGEAAAIRLAELFSDNAILQRGKPIHVWGTAAPGEKVEVTFADQRQAAVADSEGRWRATFAPLPASGTPRTLTAKAGNSTATANNILIGEVWLLSGQSNMAFLMTSVLRAKNRSDPAVVAARAEIASANDPQLRLFRVENRPAELPRRDIPTRNGWMTWNKKSAPEFSALAYYFAKKLRAELKVPVGILNCSWGGSSCVSWLTPEAVRSLRGLHPQEVVGWSMNTTPSQLSNGMLSPCAPFALSGFAWYQGETEATPAFNAYLYREFLKTMITDWRRLWRDDKLPFHIVQLPNLKKSENWPVVRESQTAALTLPGVHLIPAIDIGDPGDLHPKDKEPLAGRLADQVLHTSYKKNTWNGLPVPERISISKNQITVVLRHDTAAPLQLRTTDKQPPRAFEIAGADRQFHPADAAIASDNTLVLSSDKVRSPLAVRYAWSGAPEVNLVDQFGMPALPFRSDKWPLPTQEMAPQKLPVKSALENKITGHDLVADKPPPGWTGSDFATLANDPTKWFVKKAGDNMASVLVRGRVIRKGLPESPAIFWTQTLPQISPKGLTIEARIYAARSTNPELCFDFNLVVQLPDSSFRRYRLNIAPMRVSSQTTTELRTLAFDLDYNPAVYRVALRPDGIAQIYRDGELLGTLSGVPAGEGEALRPTLTIGKTTASGAWAASVYHICTDNTGAYAPEPARFARQAAVADSDE